MFCLAQTFWLAREGYFCLLHTVDDEFRDSTVWPAQISNRSRKECIILCIVGKYHVRRRRSCINPIRLQCLSTPCIKILVLQSLCSMQLNMIFCN